MAFGGVQMNYFQQFSMTGFIRPSPLSQEFQTTFLTLILNLLWFQLAATENSPPMIYHLQLSYGLVLVCFSFYHLITLCKLVIFLSLKCCQEPFKNEVNAKLAFYRPHSPLYFLLPSRPCYRYELHNKHKQPLKEQK